MSPIPVLRLNSDGNLLTLWLVTAMPVTSSVQKAPYQHGQSRSGANAYNVRARARVAYQYKETGTSQEGNFARNTGEKLMASS